MHSLTLKKILFVTRCFHMIVLRDFIDKNVWDSYVGESRRPQWKQCSKDFLVLPLQLHIMIVSIY